MTMKPPFWWCAPRMQRWCLGGIRLENAAKNYLVDETLDFSLQEQRDWFYTHSGLTVED